MRDFLLLVKAVQASGLNMNRTRKGKLVKKGNFALSTILVGLLLTFSLASQVFRYLSATVNVGFTLEEHLPFLYIMFTGYLIYSLGMSLAFAAPIYFKGNNDVFLSLPISGNKFFLAKFAITFFINAAYGGLAPLVSSIMACVMLHLPFYSYLISILIFLIFLIVVPCLAFLLVNVLSKFVNFKDGKVANFLITFILILLVACGVMLVNLASSGFKSDMTKEFALQSIEKYASHFTWITWLGYLSARSLLMRNGSDALLFLGLVVFALVVAALALLVSRRTYLSHLGKTFKTRSKALTKEQKIKKMEKQMALLDRPKKLALQREFANYTSDSSIFINSAAAQIGVIVSLAITFGGMALAKASADMNGQTGMNDMTLYILGICFMMFSFYFTGLSFAAVSLEKKNLALMKTLPISSKKMINQKLMPSLIIYLPTAILIFLLYALLVRFNLEYFLSLLMMLLAYPITIILFGFLMGVCFPNFNYDTSAELFNRGKGIVFSHLGHFLLSAIGSALIVVGAKVIGHLWVGALMASVLFIGLAVLFYFLSNKRLQTMLVKEITF